MADERSPDPPSSFVLQWMSALVPTLPEPRRALDIAVGRGRHAVPLARAGLRVFGVDARYERVRDAVEEAARQGLVVRGWCADLTTYPLPRSSFELVLVTRYLQRDLFGAIREAVVPGGVVIYETFTIGRLPGPSPKSPYHLLDHGELPSYFATFEVIFYEEASAPEAVARIVARRRRPPEE